MPCDTRRLTPEQTLEQRNQQVRAALRRLELQLTAGRVSVNIGPQGAVAFTGWQDRDGLSDVCAYRVLSVEGSSVLRMAVQRAEQLSGRRVNANAVAAGFHTHDGNTWSKH